MKCYFREGFMTIPFISVTSVVAKRKETINNKRMKNGEVPEIEGYLVFVLGGNLALSKESGERFDMEYIAWLNWNDMKEELAARSFGFIETQDEVSEMRFKSNDEGIEIKNIQNPINIKVEKSQITPKRSG